MPSTDVPSRKLPWLLIPLRVLLVSLLVALLSFAVCLLLGILGLSITAWLRGVQPDMTAAYRHIAFPAAIVIGAGALVGTIVSEVRHYRRQVDDLR
jgi:uncharacterized RDD family membrane protein YckC